MYINSKISRTLASERSYTILNRSDRVLRIVVLMLKEIHKKMIMLLNLSNHRPITTLNVVIELHVQNNWRAVNLRITVHTH